MKKFLFLLLFAVSSFAATGSWNGVGFTAWNGVAQTAWNGSSISCASGGGGISSPLDIANCVLWLDGSDATKLYTDSGLTTLVSANNDPVGGWKDKSAGAHDATQTTSAARPTYKTNFKNSKSVLLFDGSDDQFSISVGTLTPRTVFVVARSDSVSNGSYETVFGVGSAAGFFFRVTDGTGTFVCDLYNSGDHDSASSPVQSWVVFSLANDGNGGADDNIYKNGSSYATTPLSSSAAYDSIGGASGFYLTGYIAEIVAYDRLLNSTEIGQVHTYLNAKWAVY